MNLQFKENKENKEKAEPIQLLNLSVENKCYSCNQSVNFSDQLILDSKKLNLTETQIKDHQHCKNCKAPILLILGFPLSYANQILSEDLCIKVAPENIEALKQKHKLVMAHYKVATTFSSGMYPYAKSCVNFPVNYVFSVETSISGTFLKIIAWNKISPQEYESTSAEKLHDLARSISDKSQIPDYIGSANIDTLGVNYHNIDRSRYLSYKSFISLDIDGTSTCKFLSKHELSPKAKLSTVFFRFLSLLEKEKIAKIIINTGRPIEWATLCMLDLGLDPLAIAQNGNQVVYRRIAYDASNSNLHTQASHIKPLILGLIDILRKKYLLSLPLAWTITGASPLTLIVDHNEISKENLQKILVEDEEISSYLDSVNLKNLQVTKDEGGFISLSPYNISKSETLKKLLNTLKVDSKNLAIHIGNHNNDIPMCQFLKTYAVSNSLDQYKKRASYTSEKPESKGAFEGISNFLIQQKLVSSEKIAQLIQTAKKQTSLQIEEILS